MAYSPTLPPLLTRSLSPTTPPPDWVPTRCLFPFPPFTHSSISNPLLFPRPSPPPSAHLHLVIGPTSPSSGSPELLLPLLNSFPSTSAFDPNLQSSSSTSSPTLLSTPSPQLPLQALAFPSLGPSPLQPPADLVSPPPTTLSASQARATPQLPRLSSASLGSISPPLSETITSSWPPPYPGSRPTGRRPILYFPADLGFVSPTLPNTTTSSFTSPTLLPTKR